MAELKTKATKANVIKFLQTIEPEQKRVDSLALLKLFEKITGEKAVLWGTSIVGFGKYHYKSDRSTQEGDWPLVAFSPRKQNLTLYIMAGTKDYKEFFDKLGKHKTSSGSCVYINKLSDVDLTVLAALIKASYQYMKQKYS